LRIKDVSGNRRDLITLRAEQAKTLDELNGQRALLDAIGNPAWTRGQDGALTWVNTAYATAVEAADRTAAISQGIELLDRPAREASALAREHGGLWRCRAPAVVVSQRRMLDIVELPTNQGSIGMATDISELESLAAALTRQMQAHAQTLDQLSTAVAIFDQSKRLVFHNAAYRQLWGFDQATLDQSPTDSELLDRLRAVQLLPEQIDFRGWKESLLGNYRSMETIPPQSWYLPDGRTIRVIINPNPQGGVTYLFDDITQSHHLQSQFNALIRVQGETLDALKEGVAVFGSDGRLKLFNPAFAEMWTFAADELLDQPHIDRVAEACTRIYGEETAWRELRTMIAGLQDQRLSFGRRLTRSDSSFLDCAIAPLPDGATLLTFIDTTASVNVEHALTERNQALLDAEKLRNDFVHHVSFQLRSPLTNVIGFIQFLGDGSIGELNAKQREYLGDASKSASALLAMIDDILDLASIDIDALELSLEKVDIAKTMQAASEGIQDRLSEFNLTLLVVAPDNVGSFIADGKRIRQILFNLLSNAIGFSNPGQTVTLAALRRGEDVVFKVSDQGRGIPPEVIDHVFERFKTDNRGARHHGAGLGLSIVRSFVELHGGRVLIDTAPGIGTTVTCIFPAQNAKFAQENTA
jgi:signal transduction histidine kinase